MLWPSGWLLHVLVAQRRYLLPCLWLHRRLTKVRAPSTLGDWPGLCCHGDSFTAAALMLTRHLPKQFSASSFEACSWCSHSLLVAMVWGLQKRGGVRWAGEWRRGGMHQASSVWCTGLGCESERSGESSRKYAGRLIQYLGYMWSLWSLSHTHAQTQTAGRHAWRRWQFECVCKQHFTLCCCCCNDNIINNSGSKRG